MRTARGAGRLEVLEERLFDAGLRRVWLPDDRVLDEVEPLLEAPPFR